MISEFSGGTGLTGSLIKKLAILKKTGFRQALGMLECDLAYWINNRREVHCNLCVKSTAPTNCRFFCARLNRMGVFGAV